MSDLSPWSRRPARRPRGRVLFAVAGIAVAFLVGLSLGRALEDGPAPGETRTSVRTLRPLPLLPAASTTVTVTVTTPPYEAPTP